MFLILAGRLIRNHFFCRLLTQRTCPGRGHMAYVQYVNATAFHIHKLKSTSLQLDRFLCAALVAFTCLRHALPLPLAPPLLSTVPYFPAFCFTIRFAALLFPFFQHARIHTSIYLAYTQTHTTTYTHTHTRTYTEQHSLTHAIRSCCCACCLLFDMHRLHKWEPSGSRGMQGAFRGGRWQGRPRHDSCGTT